MVTARLERLLAAAAAAALLTGFYMALAVVPPDRLMGEVQRLMYVHVPTAWVGLLAFTVVFACSIGYLVTRRFRWDRVGHAAAELGVLFMGLAIALGSLWGKPTWGVWWTWDPRLTTAAILMAVYLGYLALRAFADDREQRARWSAVVGIIGFLDVPIVYLSVLWWRTLHQPPSGPETVAAPMLATLWVSVLAFTLLFVYLLAVRVRLAGSEDRVEELELSHV